MHPTAVGGLLEFGDLQGLGPFSLSCWQASWLRLRGLASHYASGGIHGRPLGRNTPLRVTTERYLFMEVTQPSTVMGPPLPAELSLGVPWLEGRVLGECRQWLTPHRYRVHSPLPMLRKPCNGTNPGAEPSSSPSSRLRIARVASHDSGCIVGNREVIAEPSFLEDESSSSVLQRSARGPETGSRKERPPMNPFFYSEGAGAKGLPPLSPAPPIPAEPASASLRTISLDDSEHLRHNHHVSVASLRLLFTFTPERRSASLRNRCSPSPEYPAVGN